MKKHLLIRSLSACLLLSSFTVLSHAGHGTQAPWQACEAKALNQSCSYVNHDKKATGTCQAMNQVLMCVRNQPLEELLTQPTVATKESSETEAKVNQHNH